MAWARRVGVLLKFPDNPLVSLPLEWHDEVGKLAHLDPAPVDEFRLVAARRRRHIDLAVLAGKAQCIPLLLLPAIFAAPCLADDVAGNVISDPARNLAELFDRPDVGLFIELAQ